MNNISTRQKGKNAEDIACEYLCQNGYRIVSRNYTVRGGELDIVACCDGTVVFVEVKSRKNELFGKASEAVGKTKISRLVCAAERFLFENGEKDDIKGRAVRFDVIEVYTQNRAVRHIKNIDIN